MPRPRFVIGLLLACLVLIAPAAPALAHGELVGSSPSPGERVGKVTHIDLVFSTAVFDFAVELEAPDGAMLPGQTVQKADPLLSFETAPLTDPGQYIVHYELTDDDGDRLDGAYAFLIEEGAPGPEGLAIDVSGLLDDDGTDWLLYGVLMAGVVVIAILGGLLAEKLRRLRALR